MNRPQLESSLFIQQAKQTHLVSVNAQRELAVTVPNDHRFWACQAREGRPQVRVTQIAKVRMGARVTPAAQGGASAPRARTLSRLLVARRVS